MLRLSSALLLLLTVAACGGGGGSGGAQAEVPPPNPDIALVFVSGHQGLLNGSPSLSYLHEFLGPQMVDDLEDAGYSVSVGYFVDHPTDTNAGGYGTLVNDMVWIRDNWVSGRTAPTRVIVVAHSHGGVWATAAIRQVPSLPIRMQVALDHSSYGWGVVGHDLHDDTMGGDPRDEFEIPNAALCPLEDVLASESGDFFDLEDVVFPTVQSALEVRSGENPGILTQRYDERWNVRLDGSGAGLSCYFSDSSHDEPRSTTGNTYPVVINWILTGLALD